MREIRSYGTVGEPVGDHRLYPDVRWLLTVPGENGMEETPHSAPGD
jgi:hypothetical protein